MYYKIGEVEDYDSTFSRYEPPVQVGCFSTDYEYKFCDDDHQLKYLSMPENLTNLHMDLNEGYWRYIHDYNEEEPTYNKVLRWIISHKEEVKDLFMREDSSKNEIDFICRRGVLTKICSTLYDRRNDWCIYATKFRSVIYLRNIRTDEKIQHEASLTETERRMTSYGYKFEQCITSDSINSKPNTCRPVNVNEKYYAMIKGKFENHGILFGGEIDAMDPQSLFDSESNSDSMNRFVEIKTNYLIRTGNMRRNFRLKQQKWYVQSFVAGIPRVICGFRKEHGIVREIEVFNISDLPEMAEGLWSSDVCLNFGSHFLNFVKEFVVKDDPKVVYKFHWKPGRSEITCEELSPDYQFLPKWYTEEILAS